MQIDEKAAEKVFQQFKHVNPRLNRAAIGLLCTAYETTKEAVSLKECVKAVYEIELPVHTLPDDEFYAEIAKAVLATARIKYVG